MPRSLDCSVYGFDRYTYNYFIADCFFDASYWIVGCCILIPYLCPISTSVIVCVLCRHLNSFNVLAYCEMLILLCIVCAMLPWSFHSQLCLIQVCPLLIVCLACPVCRRTLTPCLYPLSVSTIGTCTWFSQNFQGISLINTFRWPLVVQLMMMIMKEVSTFFVALLHVDIQM